MNPLGDGKFQCTSCSFIDQGELVTKEEIKQEEERKEGIVKDKNIFADYEHTCKECGHNKAQIIERQPYISDEDTLTFIKCGKCGHTIQLSRKIG